MEVTHHWNDKGEPCYTELTKTTNKMTKKKAVPAPAPIKTSDIVNTKGLWEVIRTLEKLNRELETVAVNVEVLNGMGIYFSA